MHWVCAATLDDLWQGEMRTVNIDGKDLLLCNIDGEVVAYEDRCPHLANPLSKGLLDGHVLTCAAHEWAFDVRTGSGVNPAEVCLRRFQVRVERDSVLVDIHGPSE
jgi:toluene monooxygenase system ferredoxin subunit